MKNTVPSQPKLALKALLLVIGMTSLTSAVFGQKVKGKITDADQKNLDYVTVTLLKIEDSSLVKGDASDQNGLYEIEAPQPGKYILSAHTLGYQKQYQSISVENADLTLNLTLVKNDKTLKEVKILSKKPMIEVKADKTVFNVEQSINATGSNALDLLRKSPGVRVDKDENVEMRGKNNVMIYIDGKPTYLDNKDLASMLKNMQSQDIESIELITNPSAKYDAEGNAGIINIRLKKNKKFGTNGSANVGYGIGQYSKYNAGLNLNYRNKNVNVFGNYGYNYGQNMNNQNLDRRQNGFRYDFKAHNVDSGTSHTLKAGLDYYLDSKNVIGVMVSGMLNTGTFRSESRTNIGPADGEADRILIATNRIPLSRNNGTINFNYKYEDTSGRSFNMDADYGTYYSQGRSYQPNTYWNMNETSILSQSIFKNFTPTRINIYSFKSDYEQNFMKGKLGLGLKTAYVRTENTFEFYDVVQNVDTLNLERTNSFTYNENVNAAYINYSRSWTKWSTQWGLRAEQTNSKGMLSSARTQDDDTVKRQYLNLFPSAGITYTLNAKNTFGLTYSRRIDRPNYQDLNPFENKLDELTYEKGNAFLRPQYTNAFDFTHTYRQYVTTSLSYSRTKDLYMQTTDTTEFSRTYVTQKNFASLDLYGLNISFPVPVKKWWMVFANINANYNMLSANFEGRKLQNNYLNYSFYADNTFTLPKGYSLNVSGWVSGPSYWGGTFKTKPQGSLDLGLQKQFWKNKLTAKASLSDVFKTQPWYATSNFSGLYIKGNGNWESRQFRVNLSYRFGKNTVAKQRERETGASKENNRIKGK